MADKIQVCPDCDSPAISPRSHTHRSPPGADEQWWCRVCREDFDEPVRRERKDDYHPPGDSITEKLIEMNPEDWP